MSAGLYARTVPPRLLYLAVGLTFATLVTSLHGAAGEPAETNGVGDDEETADVLSWQSSKPVHRVTDRSSGFDLRHGAPDARSLPRVGVSHDLGERDLGEKDLGEKDLGERDSGERDSISTGSGLHRIGDTSLEQALNLTLANNPAVQGKAAEVLAQKYSLQSARLSRLPMVTTHANNLNESRDQGSFALDQPLYSFGRINANIRRERERLQAEKTDMLRVQRGLLEETALAYVNVLNRRRQLHSAQTNIFAHKDLERLIVKREQGKLASQADIVLAESRLLQAVAAGERAQAQVQSALSELQSITGTYVDPSDAFDVTHLGLPHNDDAVRDLAAHNSIEVQGKKDYLAVAKAEHDADRKSLLPTVSLRFEQEFLDDSLVNIDQSRVGLVFQSSVEGLGLVGGRRLASSAQRIQAAAYDVSYTRDEVERRVDLLLYERDLQLRLQRTYGKLVQALEDTSASTRRQYEAGRRSWLDLLNIQREVSQQRELVDRAVHDAVNAAVRLAALCGLLDVEAASYAHD